jgi:hypothetical protein
LAVVDGKQGFLASVTLAAKDHETTNEGESEQNQNEESDHEVDHRIGKSAIVVVTCDESG